MTTPKKAAKRHAIKTRKGGVLDQKPAKVAKRTRAKNRPVRTDGRTGAMNGPTVFLGAELVLPVLNEAGRTTPRKTVTLNPAQKVTLYAASGALYGACINALRCVEGVVGLEGTAEELRRALNLAYQG